MPTLLSPAQARIEELLPQMLEAQVHSKELERLLEDAVQHGEQAEQRVQHVRGEGQQAEAQRTQMSAEVRTQMSAHASLRRRRAGVSRVGARKCHAMSALAPCCLKVDAPWLPSV